MAWQTIAARAAPAILGAVGGVVGGPAGAGAGAAAGSAATAAEEASRSQSMEDTDADAAQPQATDTAVVEKETGDTGSVGPIPYLDDVSNAVGSISRLGAGVGGIANLAERFTKSAGDRGAAAGTAQRAYLDNAFPGTTPWERLGSSPGGSSAAVAERGQDFQEQQQMRMIGAQERIAERNALAQIIPSVIETHPQTAGALINRVAPGALPGAMTAGKAMQERRYELDKIWKTTQLALQGKDVSTRQFNALTQRIQTDIQAGALDWKKTYEAAMLEFKDKEVATAITNMMAKVYQITGAGNFWNMIYTMGHSVDTEGSLLNAMNKMLKKLSESAPEGGAPRPNYNPAFNAGP